MIVFRTLMSFSVALLLIGGCALEPATTSNNESALLDELWTSEDAASFSYFLEERGSGLDLSDEGVDVIPLDEAAKAKGPAETVGDPGTQSCVAIYCDGGFAGFACGQTLEDILIGAEILCGQGDVQSVPHQSL